MKKSFTENLPSALEHFSEIKKKLQGRQLALFLDYDGTLTPIVSRPEDALLSDEMRRIVRELASKCMVAVISGRDLEDVKKRVSIDAIFYAGSHGFDISGPNGFKNELPEAKKLIPLLKKAAGEMEEMVKEFPGAQIERKKFSVAIHFRNVDEPQKNELKERVKYRCRNYAGLKLNQGKQVLDLGPDLDWNKGTAVLWLLDQLPIKNSVIPLYIGDDLTDEDAFAALRAKGISIIVREEARETQADYALNSPKDVQLFLKSLLE